MRQDLQFPHWTFLIGDPSFMGWFTVGAYFFTFYLSCVVFTNAEGLFSKQTVRKQKAFWLIIAATMFFLGINKQLDLQSYLTAIGRYYAQRDGWYQYRQIFQSSFIKFILLFSMLVLTFLIWYLRDTLRDNILAICGLCLLAAFVAIRASSFHHMDFYINTRILNLRINWIIELSGIFMISLAAGLIIGSLLNSEVQRRHLR